MQMSVNLKSYACEQTREKHFVVQKNIIICTWIRLCNEKNNPWFAMCFLLEKSSEALLSVSVWRPVCQLNFFSSLTSQ